MEQIEYLATEPNKTELGKIDLTAGQFSQCTTLEDDFHIILCSLSTLIFIKIIRLAQLDGMQIHAIDYEPYELLSIMNHMHLFFKCGFLNSFSNSFDFYNCKVVSLHDKRKNEA